MNTIGHTFSVKRMQTHDGPGVRTTVFMKGCALRCAWCHNPESLSPDQEIWRDDSKCIGCGYCAGADGTRADHANWKGDIAVVDQCPAKALEALRTTWTVAELLDYVGRDAVFFENGGVTVSGGEPALQSGFVADFLRGCRARGWHTALDTCGAVNERAFAELLPLCDLVLFDLKMMDSEQHRKWTGQGNERILGNFRRVIASGARVWIRTPLIPEATATEDNIRAIGACIRDELGAAVERWDLCSFNNLCVEKYRRLNKEWCFDDHPLLDRETGARLLQVAVESVGTRRHELVFLKGRMLASGRE